MTKCKWFGNTDVGTSNHSFFFDKSSASDFHYQEMVDVLERMEKLAETKDGNDRYILEFVCKWLDAPEVLFIAYRFTSDWAYSNFSDELIKLGGGLGRGGFRPFSGNEDYNHYFGRNEK